MIKFDLRKTNDGCYADVSGTPYELVELIATIMVEYDVCARLILASVDVYNSEKEEEE